MVGGAAAATAVVAFTVGFGLAALGREPGRREQAAPTTTAPAPTTSLPASTTTTIEIAPAPSIETPTTAGPTTTQATTTTEAPTTTQAPTTVITAAPTPAYVSVDYPASNGRMVVQAGSTAQIRFTNVGEGIGQWFIQGGEQVFVVGPTSGALRAGQTRLVTVQAVPEVPSEGVTDQLTVTAAGTGTTIIPVRVVN